MIYDKPCEIEIINEQVEYTGRKGVTAYSDKGFRKTGFLCFDDKGRKVGIVFMSDDKRTQRYGNSEILYFEEFEAEFGTWRTIKVNRQYYMFEKLRDNLVKHGRIKLSIDGRYRKK